MFVDTALRADAQRRIREIGRADIVIGIPTYKNAKTIGRVMETAADGLVRYFPEARGVIMVSDGMSTDDTVQVAQMTPLPAPVEKIVTLYQGISGKGSAIRAVFEVTKALEAQTVVLLDGDLRSMTPEWIQALAEPVHTDQYDYLLPFYTRHPNEVAINDLLAYPLTRTLYGYEVRYPLGAEVALSSKLVQSMLEKDVWETDVARFGIHIWMTTLVLIEKWRVAQAALGTKTHDYKDPTVGFEPKFLQVVGTMFRLMTIYRRAWPKIFEIKSVPLLGEEKRIEPEPIPPALDSLWDAFNRGVVRFWDLWPTILTPENWDAVRMHMRQVSERAYEIDIPPDLWVRLVYDFAVVYNKGEGDPDKVVISLLPFYYARKANLIREATDWNFEMYEQHIAEQAEWFYQLKPYLIKRWEDYVPWSQYEI